MSNSHEFRGDAASYLGVGILATVLTIFTFGIAFPWAYCMRTKWYVENTYINGNQQRFVGTGGSLIFLWLKWFLLLIITFGIYSFWIIPSLQKWTVNNTEFYN